MLCVPNSFMCNCGIWSYLLFFIVRTHCFNLKFKKLLPSSVSQRSGNYRYFPSVTNCTNRVHDHASIMYLEETAPWIPSAADYCRETPGDSSAQSSWTAKLAGRLEQGASPPFVTAPILLRQPIRLTLTWQQRGTFFTLRWIACPETCLINSPAVKVSRPYSSTAASHQSHGDVVGGGGGEQ